MSDAPERRCTDCPKHSGIEAELDAGRDCMNRLEKAVSDLRLDFSAHVKTQTARTITILMLVLSTLMTGFVSIYISSISPKDQYSSQAEMTLMVKEITKAIREAKK